MKAVFNNLCPNCGGEISDIRLIMGAPCSKCLPLSEEELAKLHESLTHLEFQIRVEELLKKSNSLKNYAEVARIARFLIEFEDFFKKAMGSKLWSAQREWARRVFKGVSFAITAPTGVGKTVFGVIMALFLASRGKKSYLIVPTQSLLEQVLDKSRKFAENVNLNLSIIGYHSRLRKSERENFLEKLESGDFQVLITSSRFVSTGFDKLSKYRFDFIFVDDVDSVLKSSKNIDRVLSLVGLGEEELKLAYEAIKLKRLVVRVKSGAEKARIAERLREIEEEINDRVKKLNVGVLIVSTATGRPRGERIKLFRELLNFTIGSASTGYRNIQDTYVSRREVKKQVLELIKRLGRGGLVFVGIDESSLIEDLAQYLVENGVKAEPYYSGKRRSEAISEFSEGKIDVLIGLSSYYGLLVRGLDLPHRVRYAVFTSVPKFKFSLRISEETHPFRIYTLLNELSEYMSDRDRVKAEKLISSFRREILSLPQSRLENLSKALRGEEEFSELSRQVNLMREAIQLLSTLLSDESFLKSLEKSPFLSIKEVDGGKYIFIPDVRTYIQASGRTSRLFAGGITKGLSIVLVDDEKVFRGLVRQLSWYFEESNWYPLDEVDLNSLLREIDRDRELVLKLKRGELSVEFREPVKSALLIVESPHKAETISNFFGKPSQREVYGLKAYEVTTGDLTLNVVASKGHVFDLVPNVGFHGVLIENGSFIPVYSTIKKCSECGEQFTDDLNECPECGSNRIRDSIDVIKALRELASEVDLVYIGTDPDTEGEKIGWDIANALKTHVNEVKRIEFHEVTRRSIMKAFQSPREINENRVNAQIVRRIEDRWLGFELSRKLWERFGSKYLSAGRVQTPVLGWIINRYEEFKRSRTTIYWIKLSNGAVIEVCGVNRGLKPKQVKKMLEGLRIRVSEYVEEEREVNPPPPFATDSMLREASRIFGFSATKTMELAQTLFELGLITYHRTDSSRVSLDGVRVAKDYVSDRFGEEFFQPRRWGEEIEGAHECIRPVKPIDSVELRRLMSEGELPRIRELSWSHVKLYDLIFRRFIASQMKPYVGVFQKLRIDLKGVAELSYEALISIKRDGFNLIQPVRTKPAIKGEEVIVSVKYGRVPRVKPYTQGEVIELMKEKGIGRPSTYATILQKLLDRKYVVERNGKLIPTKLGYLVYDYLTKMFGEVVSEEVTRELERKMDLIESGMDYQKVLTEEYNSIINLVSRRVDRSS